MNLIESTTLSDADAMLAACRTELERGGFQSQADALKGLEILDVTGAEVALMTLRGLAPTGSIPSDDAIDYTKQAIHMALRGARLAS